MLKEKESPLLEIDDEETIDDFVKTQFSLWKLINYFLL